MFMKIGRLILALTISFSFQMILAQAPAFEEIEFEADSMTTPYKASGKNFVILKSKKGSGGMNRVAMADSIKIKGLQVTDIVLVFSELNSDAITDRETANRERWENLLRTYPEFFQFSTLYKNVCQCKNNGDTAAFRPAQGFYVYYVPPDPPKPKVIEKDEPEEASTSSASKKEMEDKKKEVVKEKEEKVKPTKKEKEDTSTSSASKEKEKSKKEPSTSPVSKKKEEEKQETEEPYTPGVEQTVTMTEADMAKANPKKKQGYTKPKKAKDPKACRPPCYEGGDEDLNRFFAENVALSKKQKRHSKRLEAQVRLQLNFDGSIKKAFITGEDEDLNKMIQTAVSMMNLWNPAVRNGVTVKSEVKMTLKYNKELKGMAPFETMITPRPMPKCKCVSDEEMFGG
jgi:hypothetical protein